MSRVPINKMTLLDYGFTAYSNRLFVLGNLAFDFGITPRAVVMTTDENGSKFNLHKQVKYIDELNALYLELTGTNLPNYIAL